MTRSTSTSAEGWATTKSLPQVARRFENITFDEPDTEHVLMVIVSGDAPRAETTERAKEVIAHYEKAAAAA